MNEKVIVTVILLNKPPISILKLLRKHRYLQTYRLMLKSIIENKEKGLGFKLGIAYLIVASVHQLFSESGRLTLYLEA